MKSTWTLKLLRGDARQAAWPLVPPAIRKRLGRGGLVIGAFSGTVLAGALTAVDELEQDLEQLTVLSLKVEEEQRRRGLGRQLLRRAEEEARAMGLVRLTLAYTCTRREGDAWDAFFIRSGYPLPVRGEEQYQLLRRELPKTRLTDVRPAAPEVMKRICLLRQLPGNILRTAGGDGVLPALMTPTIAGAEPLPELSLAVAGRDSLGAYVMAATQGTTLMLHAACLRNPQDAIHLVAILQRIQQLVTGLSPKITELVFSGPAILQTLLEGAQVTRRTAYQVSWPLEDGQTEDSISHRMRALISALAHRQARSTLLGGPEDLRLCITVPGADSPLEATYRREEDGLVLQARFEFPSRLRDWLIDQGQEETGQLRTENGRLTLCRSWLVEDWSPEQLADHYLLPLRQVILDLLESGEKPEIL